MVVRQNDMNFWFGLPVGQTNSIYLIKFHIISFNKIYILVCAIWELLWCFYLMKYVTVFFEATEFNVSLVKTYMYIYKFLYFFRFFYLLKEKYMHMYLPARGARNGTHVPLRPFYMQWVAHWQTSMASEWITVQMFNAKTQEEFLPQLPTMESFLDAFRNTSAMLWIRAAQLLNWISKELWFVGVQILRRQSKIMAKCQLERVLLLWRKQNQRRQMTKYQTTLIPNCRGNLTKNL